MRTLDERTKELIAVGASISANCQLCLRYHVARAREHGASEEQIGEAAAVGRMVRSGAAGNMDRFATRVVRAAGYLNETEIACGGKREVATLTDEKEAKADLCDGKSSAEIWNDFSGALKRFIRGRVQDEQAAEDILQEAFYKIHRNVGGLKNAGKLRSWLYQITRNTIIDYYRKREAEGSPAEIPEDLAEEPDLNVGVADELGPCIKALMDRLPERYREPMILTELEGLTRKEMGERLDLSLSGAKSRVQRGRDMLKGLLLECCHFELDREGNVLEYEPRSENSPDCCRGKRDCSDD